jgi:hypothetical protein
MLRLNATLLAVLLLSACASTSDSSAGRSTAAQTVASTTQETTVRDDDPGIVCERVQRTGTRFAEKVCTTRAQREEAARQAQEETRDMQMRRIQAIPGGPEPQG